MVRNINEKNITVRPGQALKTLTQTPIRRFSTKLARPSGVLSYSHTYMLFHLCTRVWTFACTRSRERVRTSTNRERTAIEKKSRYHRLGSHPSVCVFDASFFLFFPFLISIRFIREILFKLVCAAPRFTRKAAQQPYSLSGPGSTHLAVPLAATASPAIPHSLLPRLIRK